MKYRFVKMLSLFLACGLAFAACSPSAGSPDSNQTDTGGASGEAADSSGETAKGTDGEASDSAEAKPTGDEEEADTGDASLDDPLNRDGIGSNEILVVSFGTSFNDNRRKTIGAIEQKMQKLAAKLPSADGEGWDVRRAFTSQIIIDHIYDRDKEKIDNVEEALDRAADNGVKRLAVVPTHLMDGHEYNDLCKELADYADTFESITISKPLLSDDPDFSAVAEAISTELSSYEDGQTAIVLMGHGTDADSNGVYAKMQDVFSDMGKANYFVGTVEASPSLEDVLAGVRDKSYKRVVLMPMMVVAGDHANNDMAGDEDDSWKSAFEKEGFEVTCVLKGLGQNKAIRKLYARHLKASLADADAGASTANGDAGSEAGASAANGNAGTDAKASDKTDTSKVASSSETTKPQKVGSSNMTPVSAGDLKPGDYNVSVDSSSSMFSIENAQLHVAEDGMSCDMTMSGTGYLYVFCGTGEEASKASKDSLIPFSEDAEGNHHFTIPVETLDAPFSCAAFSKRKQQWYDRTLVVRADSLPDDAFVRERGTSAKSLGLKDGTYTASVSLDGGSGRATVSSPADIAVDNGRITARIEWSSPNYDYMLVNGKKLLPINQEGNSVFEIPVSHFDAPIAVKADTTAMSKPHEIAYTLLFDSKSVK